MTDDQSKLLDRARESISAARWLLEGGYPGFAASRAYYAMFYVAEALLEGEGLSFSTHSAVIAAFGQYFARTGRIPAEFHRALIRAQETRHKGDYDYADRVEVDEAQAEITEAQRFLEAAEDFCG